MLWNKTYYKTCKGVNYIYNLNKFLWNKYGVSEIPSLAVQYILYNYVGATFTIITYFHTIMKYSKPKFLIVIFLVMSPERI